MASNKSLQKCLLGCMHPPSLKSYIDWPSPYLFGAFPQSYLRYCFLDIVLILAQIKLNSQLSLCIFSVDIIVTFFLVNIIVTLHVPFPPEKLWFIQLSWVPQLCLTLCDPMDSSMPGFPVHHQLLEFTQTHVDWVGDAIQPSHPLSSPSPPAFNLSQHQGLSQWVSCSHQVAKVLQFQLQHQSFQWIFRTDFL